MHFNATCAGFAPSLCLPIQCTAILPLAQNVCCPACITCAQPQCCTQLAFGTCSGTKREKYLTENVKAFHVKLTSEDKAALEAIFHQDKVTLCSCLGSGVHWLDAV